MKRQTLLNYIKYSGKPISQIVSLATKRLSYMQKGQSYQFRFPGQPNVYIWLDSNQELESYSY